MANEREQKMLKNREDLRSLLGIKQLPTILRNHLMFRLILTFAVDDCGLDIKIIAASVDPTTVDDLDNVIAGKKELLQLANIGLFHGGILPQLATSKRTSAQEVVRQQQLQLLTAIDPQTNTARNDFELSLRSDSVMAEILRSVIDECGITAESLAQRSGEFQPGFHPTEEEITAWAQEASSFPVTLRPRFVSEVVVALLKEASA